MGDAAELLGIFAVILAAARLFGWLAQKIGQPAVLGELLAGVVLGGSVLNVVDLHGDYHELFHVFAELGVVILLFEIGLETDLGKLLRAGLASSAVALVGVVVPFGLGYAVCRWLGLDNLVAVVAGAALTATSVGITARVLSDLGRLQELESQIVLGAAVIDDVIGLVILTVVSGVAAGGEMTVAGVAGITAVAFGFLLATLGIGAFVVAPLARTVERIDTPGILTITGLILALGLAWLADAAGSAMIIGAFAAGVLLARTPQVNEIEHGVANIGHFFVPMFFVVVGAGVDLSVLNPFESANRETLIVGSLLIVAALVSKFVAGYAPFWIKARKAVIGVGMIPRGEVGLIFAQMGLSTGLFDAGMFSAVTLMVMATTFVAPPLLRMLYPPPKVTPPPAHEMEGISDLVSGPD